MPVILTTPAELESWMTAPPDEATGAAIAIWQGMRRWLTTGVLPNIAGKDVAE
jgi:hypothetical protein